MHTHPASQATSLHALIRADESAQLGTPPGKGKRRATDALDSTDTTQSTSSPPKTYVVTPWFERLDHDESVALQTLNHLIIETVYNALRLHDSNDMARLNHQLQRLDLPLEAVFSETHKVAQADVQHGKLLINPRALAAKNLQGDSGALILSALIVDQLLTAMLALQLGQRLHNRLLHAIKGEHQQAMLETRQSIFEKVEKGDKDLPPDPYLAINAVAGNLTHGAIEQFLTRMNG